MEVVVNNSDCKIIISQIIDNLNDLASFFGPATETIVNQAQRRFKSLHRHREWLTSRAILRAELGKDVEVAYHACGRPQLCGNNLNISISHSKTHVAVMLSHYNNIGVDIESPSARIKSLQSRIACQKELPVAFDILNQDIQIAHLTTLWTIKEAAYKSMPLQDGVDMLRDIVVNGSAVLCAPCASHYRIKGLAEACIAHTFLYQDNYCTYTVLS